MKRPVTQFFQLPLASSFLHLNVGFYHSNAVLKLYTKYATRRGRGFVPSIRRPDLIWGANQGPI